MISPFRSFVFGTLLLVGGTSAWGQDFTGTVTRVNGATPQQSYDTGGTVDSLTANYNTSMGYSPEWTGSGGFVVNTTSSNPGVYTVELNPPGGIATWGQSDFVPTGSALILGPAIEFLDPISLGSDPTATRQIDVGQYTNPGEDGAATVLTGAITGSGNLLLNNYSPSGAPEGALATIYTNGIDITGQITLNNVSLWDQHYTGEPDVIATAYNLSGSSIEVNITGDPDMTLTNDSSWLLNSLNTTSHSVGILNGDAGSSIDLGGLAPSGSGTVTLTVQSGYFAGTLLTDNQTSGVSTELIKDGTGIFTLAGNNTSLYGSTAFTGPIDVKQGTLLVAGTSGSATGTGPVTVESGGSFGGTGTITPSSFVVESGGKVDLTAYDPAHPPASQITQLTLTLATNNNGTTDKATFDAGASFTFDLGTPGETVPSGHNGSRVIPGQSDVLAFATSASDQVIFNENAVNFNLLTGSASGTYDLFTFSSLNAYSGTLQNGPDYYFSYNSESISVTFDAGAVPEPTTWAAFVMGLSLLRFVTWRAERNYCQRKNGTKIA